MQEKQITAALEKMLIAQLHLANLKMLERMQELTLSKMQVLENLDNENKKENDFCFPFIML